MDISHIRDFPSTVRPFLFKSSLDGQRYLVFAGLSIEKSCLMDADHILPEEEFHRHAMLVIFLFCHAEAAPMESHRRAQRGLPAAKT